jgi:DNA-binding HxlR family transcriptional regulator
MIRAGCPGGDEAGQSITLMIRVTRRQALYALKEFEGMACSIAGVLEAIGDRWAVLIRATSRSGTRYEDLRR